MHDINGKRFINSPHQRLCNTGSLKCKTQFGRNRVRRGWKCNVDAVFHDCNHITSFACYVRDSSGQFIRAQTKWQRTNMTILEEEAVALLEALHLVDANMWDRVVFESDSSTLVQALSSLDYGDLKFYVIVYSIIYQLSLHSNFKVKFVRWQVNMVLILYLGRPVFGLVTVFFILSFLYWTFVD